MALQFTAEQVTYFTTLAQVTPVLIVAIALESRFIGWLGGRFATIVLMVGIVGETCALSWLGMVAYPERFSSESWLNIFGRGAEYACALLLTALMLFGFEVLWKMRRESRDEA